MASLPPSGIARQRAKDGDLFKFNDFFSCEMKK